MTIPSSVKNTSSFVRRRSETTQGTPAEPGVWLWLLIRGAKDQPLQAAAIKRAELLALGFTFDGFRASSRLLGSYHQLRGRWETILGLASTKEVCSISSTSEFDTG